MLRAVHLVYSPRLYVTVHLANFLAHLLFPRYDIEEQRAKKISDQGKQKLIQEVFVNKLLQISTGSMTWLPNLGSLHLSSSCNLK